MDAMSLDQIQDDTVSILLRFIVFAKCMNPFIFPELSGE